MGIKIYLRKKENKKKIEEIKKKIFELMERIRFIYMLFG